MHAQIQFQRQSQVSEGRGFIDKTIKKDNQELDETKSQTLQIAFILGLGDKVTREKYYHEALEGKLTDFQEERIKEVQIGLKKDGKYLGKIDGIFGPESTGALKKMIEENGQFKEAKKLIERSEIIENKGKNKYKPEKPLLPEDRNLKKY